MLRVWTLRIEMEAQVVHSTILAWCGMPYGDRGWRRKGPGTGNDEKTAQEG